jgi:hypothetical protein
MPTSEFSRSASPLDPGLLFYLSCPRDPAGECLSAFELFTVFDQAISIYQETGTGASIVQQIRLAGL